MKKISFKQEGFTLIELLIVVAIIAILAAIAIPNFLAAQTRSKVSKLKAEFKTLATAIESYYVDENTYPIHSPQPPSYFIQNGIFGKDAFGSYRFDVLTTPVAYISSMPEDPFAFVGKGSSLSSGIGYFLYTWEKFDTGSGNGGPYTNIYHASYWALRSKGTDGAWTYYYNTGTIQYPWYNTTGCVDGDITEVSYDPSNGTISRGDIYRTSKKGQL